MRSNFKEVFTALGLIFMLAACSSRDSDKVIEQAVVSQLATHFNMDPKDLEASTINVQVTPDRTLGGQLKYHAVGNFTLSWSDPKNVYEAAQQVVNQNICAISPKDCKDGFRHTIYLDVVVSRTAAGRDFVINGDVALDQTLEQQKQQQEAQVEAADAAREQQVEEQRQQAADAAKQLAMQEAQAKEQVILQRHTSEIAELESRIHREYQEAVSELDANQEKQKAALIAEITHLREQQNALYAQQAARRQHGYTTQMEKMEQQESLPLAARMQQLQDEQMRFYGEANMQHQQLSREFQAREASELAALKERQAHESDTPASSSTSAGQ